MHSGAMFMASVRMLLCYGFGGVNLFEMHQACCVGHLLRLRPDAHMQAKLVKHELPRGVTVASKFR